MKMLLFRPHMTLAVVLALLLPFAGAQTGPGSTPVRYQAQYTQIYFDDIETVAPTLTPGFVLNTGGSLTTNPAEVISGKRSIKGVGTGSYSNFLNTNSQIIPFASKGSYRVTFHYRVVATLDQGFQAVFYSNAGARDNYAGPYTAISGPQAQAGQTGTATLTATLGPYSDYQVYWAIFANGAVVVDDIQITDTVTGKLVAAEDAEASAATVGPGLQLQTGATVVTDPALVLAGKASLQLSNSSGWQTVATNPAVVPLASNTTYIVEFQYRVIDRGSGDTLLYLTMQPAGSTDNKTIVNMQVPLKNVATSGTFSSGAPTGGAGPYVLRIASDGKSTVVIDNITIYRQDTVQTSSPPPAWARLASLPFPRLGNYSLQNPASAAQYAPAERTPFLYSAEQIENRLAFSDVLYGPAGVAWVARTPDLIRRLRNLNPNMVILPQLESEGLYIAASPADAGLCLDCQFLSGVADEWRLRDSKGQYIFYQGYPYLAEVNITEYCPEKNGNTWNSYLSGYLAGTIFPLGLSDGVVLDGLNARVQPAIGNWSDPALFDADYNRNGIRDETPALATELTAKGVKQQLQQLRNLVGDSQIVVGNAGKRSEPNLAPYVNGFVVECFNQPWDTGSYSYPVMQPGSRTNEGSWREQWDTYRLLQANLRSPKVNVLEACGQMGDIFNPDHAFATPTARDILQHRFAMGTALLSDGFYEYDLFDVNSAPYWFDEYSVGADGTAIEDRTKKGYLGAALSDAQELASDATLVLQEDFESGVMPKWLRVNSGSVSVTRAPGETISGGASLLLSNPDHTKLATTSALTDPSILPLTSGTYVIQFDWRILETLDANFTVAVVGAQWLGNYDILSVLAGESGTTRFPVTIPSTGIHVVNIFMSSGGKVAIDNFTIYRGGAGPWRRDFENGFVLVNPLNSPHTFSAADLAGSLGRTGIHRIKGTQAPDVNNGQPVTGELTLDPFDAIILLANHIDAHAAAPSTAKPYIKPNGIISAGAFGGFSTAAPGSWIEIYGSNLSATSRGWAGTDFNGPNAPISLDGVKVTIGGRAAFIAYISPGQVNALVPSDVPAGPVQVVISGPTGTSDPYIAVIEAMRPGLLAPSAFQINGKQYVAAFFSDNVTFAMPSGAIPGVPSRPAKPGETVVLWGIGFGPVTPNVPAGVLVSQANSLSVPLQVSFGSTPAKLAYSGLAPQSTGLYQFNVVVPDVPDSSAVPLTISLAGVPGTQTLYIAVQH